MGDPYKVLGVSPNASDDEIKSAYRELAKKYHPDNYANNPLADLALEKMKEINEAYDEVTRRRSGGGSSRGGGYGGPAGGYSGGSSGSAHFSEVRVLINQNRVGEAEQVLESVPDGERDAEWYFLRGSVFYKKGWTNEAIGYFQRAVNMDPGNGEYRNALQQLSSQMGGFGGFGGGFGQQQGGPSACDCCAGLACADCLCNGGFC